MRQYSSAEYEELDVLNRYTNNLIEGLENSPDMSNQLKNNIMQQDNNINKMERAIQSKDDEFERKMHRSIMQEKEIEYKKKLITTRDRMLQLSQEKNVYKGKVMYTLLAIIIFLVCIMLAVYIYFSKK